MGKGGAVLGGRVLLWGPPRPQPPGGSDGAAARLPGPGAGRKRPGRPRRGGAGLCAPRGSVGNRVPGAVDSVSVVASDKRADVCRSRSLHLGGQRLCSLPGEVWTSAASFPALGPTFPDLQELPFACGGHKALLYLMR